MIDGSIRMGDGLILSHGHNSNGEVHTKGIYVEEAKEGQYCN